MISLVLALCKFSGAVKPSSICRPPTIGLLKQISCYLSTLSYRDYRHQQLDNQVASWGLFFKSVFTTKHISDLDRSFPDCLSFLLGCTQLLLVSWRRTSGTSGYGRPHRGSCVRRELSCFQLLCWIVSSGASLFTAATYCFLLHIQNLFSGSFARIFWCQVWSMSSASCSFCTFAFFLLIPLRWSVFVPLCLLVFPTQVSCFLV